MKFTPTNQVFVFEPISTPNKNIQSYFMKSEQSFFTSEEFKFPNYAVSESIVSFFIGNNHFYIDETKVEQDCFVDDRFNVEKYGSRQKCIDLLYLILNSEIKRKNEMQTTVTDQMDSKNITNLSQNTKISQDFRVQLIFGDFMCRSDILAIIDVLLNSLGFKSIMILPLSLALSFYLNQNYSAFVYKNGFSFVDDFCLIDSFDFYPRNERYTKVLVDDIDFAEEYSRLTILDDTMIFSCLECGLKEDNEEKIISHSTKEHTMPSFFKFERSEDFVETFSNRMKYLFKKDEFEKVCTKVYSIDIDFPQAEKIENAIDLAIAGAKLFSNLEISKELWMTDCEWRIARLRILKEKLLFYI